MAKDLGLGTMMYSPLAGGVLTGKYRNGESGRINRGADSEYHEDAKTKKIIDGLIDISNDLDATPGQIAFAWVLSKNSFPLIGARKLSHLDDSLKATTIQLSDEQIIKLNQLSEISLGYPHDLLASVRG